MRFSVREGFLLDKTFFLSVTVLLFDRVPIRQWLSFQIGPIRGMISSHENGMGSARLGSVLTWQALPLFSSALQSFSACSGKGAAAAGGGGVVVVVVVSNTIILLLLIISSSSSSSSSRRHQ